MRAWKIALWVFVVCQVIALIIIAIHDWKLAGDIVLIVVYTPAGMLKLLEHGYAPAVATNAGVLGGMLMTVNYFLLFYYGLKYFLWVRRIASLLHKGEPASPPRNFGHGWLRYLSFFWMCCFDISLALAGAAVSNLNPCLVLAIGLVISALRNYAIGRGAGLLGQYFPSLIRTAGFTIIGVMLIYSAIEKRAMLGHLLHRYRAVRRTAPKPEPAIEVTVDT